MIALAGYPAVGVLAAACVTARYGRRVRPVVLPQVVIAWPVVLILALIWLHPAGRARLRPFTVHLPRREPGRRTHGFKRPLTAPVACLAARHGWMAPDG